YSTTTYTAELRDSLNCVSLQAYSTVSVVICTGVDNVSLNNSDFSFYPNPAKEKIYITYPGLLPKGKLILTNSLGQTVLAAELPSQELDLVGLPVGYYTLELTSATSSVRRKLVKSE